MKRLVDLVIERCRPLSGSPKLAMVYLALEGEGQTHRPLFRSMEQIGFALGISPRRARDAIRECEQAGWLFGTGAGGRGLAREYRINVQRLCQQSLLNPDDSGKKTDDIGHVKADISGLNPDDSGHEETRTIPVTDDVIHRHDAEQTQQNATQTRTIPEKADDSGKADNVVRPRTLKATSTAKKIPIPPGFGISADVKAWADANGHQQLERHLEYFVGYAKANGKTYADWDQAFMNAIRGNWAKLEQDNGSTAGRKTPSLAERAEASERSFFGRPE